MGVAILLLACSACSQRWGFAPPDNSGVAARPLEAPAPSVQAKPPPPQTAPLVERPTAEPTALGSYAVLGRPVFLDESSAAATAFQSFSAARDFGAEPADGAAPGPTFLPSDCPKADWAEPSAGPRFHALWQRTKHRVWSDHRNYYSWSTLRDFGLSVAIAAPLANTSVDRQFRDWYQDDVRSTGSDNFASFWKTFGQGQIFIPSFAALALVGGYFEDRPLIGTAGAYGGRVTRAYLVGAPPMLLMQYTLGAGRPGEYPCGSRWQPFRDSHGVSGHAFMGSIPFITAANMVESPWLKAPLYVLSTFTAWSRVNDDDHYLTQIYLGWMMGYLACRAVHNTDLEDQNLTVAPIASPEMIGVGVVYRR